VSEPKRYGLSRETCDIVEWWCGPYVDIEDYQKIEDKCQRYKSEVERLTLLQAETLAERNKAEVQIERLTKAGDAMANTLRDGGVIVSGYSLADEWCKAKLHAAKDGKDTQ